MERVRLRQLVREVLLDSEYNLCQSTRRAFEEALSRETSQLARVNMKVLMDDRLVAQEDQAPPCSDTGNPIWYVVAGTAALSSLDGGLPALERIIREVTSELTRDGLIQGMMIDPLKHGINTNVGDRIPDIHYRFRDSNYIELISTPKGCGSETWGSYFKVLMYTDGIDGMKKFVMDSVITGARHGKTCPPNVGGIGIGGTADLCTSMAKEAALLRPIGDRHPDPDIAALEKELLAAMNATGIGPGGMGGKCTALDVHIETALANSPGFPVAVNMQCASTHIAVLRLYNDGRVEKGESTSWFQRRQ